MIWLFYQKIILSYSLIFKIWFFQINGIIDLCPKWKHLKKHQSSPKQFFLRNHWLNNRCFRKCVSKCGGTKYFHQIIYEACIFVTRNIQQKQTDFVACCRQQNSLLKCCKTKLFCYGRRWNISMQFVKNMFLQPHEKIAPCLRSFILHSHYLLIKSVSIFSILS